MNILESKVNSLTLVRERELTEEHFKGRSLVISLGGDGCFLRTSSLCTSSETPMLGVNTDPSRSLGILCGKFIYKNRNQQKIVEKLITQIEEEQYTWLYRQRFMCEVKRYNENGEH